MINKLKIRNNKLLERMEYYNIKDKNYYELKVAINKDYVTEFWIGSKN